MIHNLLNNPKSRQIAEEFVRGSFKGAAVGIIVVCVSKFIGLDLETFIVYKPILFIALAGVIGMIIGVMQFFIFGTKK
jgi:hypothetical protein